MASLLLDLQREELAAMLPGQVRFDELLSAHTTLKIGGPADAWAEPSSREELQNLVRYCFQEGLPMTSFGGGSNLLVRDKGVRGVVLSTKQLRKIKREAENGIFVQAGVSTGKLLSSAMKWGLGGVEFLGGVPGSVGGGLVMNAGTFLGEFKDVTTSVTSLHLETGELRTRTNLECEFSYRSSSLPTSEVIVDALLTLATRDLAEMKETVRKLKARRKEREPSGASNAGSVFKNPEGDYAGRLLETAGFKGTTIGHAACSMQHANWFVNHGGASASDMLSLVHQARSKVKAAHGIDLVLEWKCIGEE